MTETSADKPLEAWEIPVDIGDFTTGSTKAAAYADGVVILAHSGDGVTIGLKAPYTKLVIRHKQTERINKRIPDPLVFGYREEKSEPTHADNVYVLTSDVTHTGGLTPFAAGETSKTITNNNEKTETKTVGGAKEEWFYDFNHYVTLDEAWIGEHKCVLKAVKLPPPDDGDKKEAAFPWWIVGVGVTAAIIIVIAIYLWKRGRPAAMPSPGAAPAPAPAAPNITVVK